MARALIHGLPRLGPITATITQTAQKYTAPPVGQSRPDDDREQQVEAQLDEQRPVHRVDRGHADRLLHHSVALVVPGPLPRRGPGPPCTPKRRPRIRGAPFQSVAAWLPGDYEPRAALRYGGEPQPLGDFLDLVNAQLAGVVIDVDAEIAVRDVLGAPRRVRLFRF
jgi:hypothetical protein